MVVVITGWRYIGSAVVVGDNTNHGGRSFEAIAGLDSKAFRRRQKPLA